MSKQEQSAQTPPDVGDLSQWRNRIRQFIEIDKAVHAEQRAIETIMSDTGREIRAETTILKHADTAAGINDQFGRLGALMDRLPMERRITFERNQEIRAITQVALGREYLFLAARLRPVEPAPYITRALGRPLYEAGAKVWHVVRGKVELGRQLLGVTGTDITLGPPPTEDWEKVYHGELTEDIQRVQIGQIMLTGADTAVDSRAVAAEFGKSAIVEELGPPPPYSPTDVSSLLETGRTDAWSDAAFTMLREIEPLGGGLLIDRP